MHSTARATSYRPDPQRAFCENMLPCLQSLPAPAFASAGEVVGTVREIRRAESIRSRTGRVVRFRGTRVGILAITPPPAPWDCHLREGVASPHPILAEEPVRLGIEPHVLAVVDGPEVAGPSVSRALHSLEPLLIGSARARDGIRNPLGLGLVQSSLCKAIDCVIGLDSDMAGTPMHVDGIFRPGFKKLPCGEACLDR